MQIVTDTDSKYEVKWNDFIQSHPNGNIFQTSKMFELYFQTKKLEPIRILTVDDKVSVIGVLLAVVQKEHTGILGHFSARSIIWGGPLIKDNNPDVLNFTLSEYNKRIKGKAIYSQFRNIWDWSNEEKGIFFKNGFKFNEHLDILIDLRKPENVLLMEMHIGRRKNIRRAERLPLTFSEVESTVEFDTCIRLIENTYKRVKLPCPDKTFFNNANKLLTGQFKLKKFAAKYQNEIISCRFALCYKELVYDWFAGTDDAHLDKYPNDYLPWKILEWSKKNGYKTFDFGGAGKPNEPYGVREYKLKFGGDLCVFGRFERVNSKFLYYFGKVGFYLLMKIKNR